jgi:hypothetical protein
VQPVATEGWSNKCLNLIYYLRKTLLMAMLSNHRSNGTGVEVFFIRYRKIVTVFCVLLLLYFPVHIYLDAPTVTSAHMYEAIGFWLNDVLMYLAVPLGMLVYTRRVYKAHVKEVAEIDQANEDKHRH